MEYDTGNMIVLIHKFIFFSWKIIISNYFHSILKKYYKRVEVACNNKVKVLGSTFFCGDIVFVLQVCDWCNHTDKKNVNLEKETAAL